MMLVLAGQATATRRRMYFHLVLASDGMTPAAAEAGGQPQISTNGGAYANTGIGTLTAMGTSGDYYADLTQAAVASSGDTIRGRYKSVNTAECPATEMVRVVAFDVDDVAALGLSRLDAAVSSVAAAVWSVGSRTLTAFGFAVDLSVGALASIVAGVWSAATRTLTQAVDLSTAAVDAVWAATSRTLTGGVDLTPASVQAVWDAQTSALTTDGSIGEYVLQQLAVAGDDSLTNPVPGSYPSGSAGAALGRIGSGVVQYVSPLSEDGSRMDVKRGDDYLAVDARAFVWTDGENMWLDPLATATFTARIGGVITLTKPCEITVATGPGKQVRLELTAAETAQLELGTPAYRFDVELVDADGHKDSAQIHGRMYVAEDQTHA